MRKGYTMSSEPGAEKALCKLQKSPQNLKCANCQDFAQHGHGAVVMKYGIFVCHTCKSAHQSYSHLCKSVSMSFWSHKEVDQLRRGGNTRARATYFATMDPSNAITAVSNLVSRKTFVSLAYNEKLWYEESDAVEPEEDVPKRRKNTKPKLRKAAPAVRQVTPAVDLLCLDDPAPAAPVASSGFAFLAPPPGGQQVAADPPSFAAFASAPAAAPSSFVAFEAAPAAPPAAPFADFGAAKVVSPAAAPATFDPFGDSGVLQPTPTANGYAAPPSNGAPMNGAAPPMMNGGMHAPRMNGSAPMGNGAAFTPQPMALGVVRPDTAHAISSMGLAMAPPPVRAPSAPSFAAFGLPVSTSPSRGASAPPPTNGWATFSAPPATAYAAPPPPPSLTASCSSPPMKHNMLQPGAANISNMFNF